MVSRFSRTLRSVQADGFGLTTPLLAIAIPLALAWGLWMYSARVPVHVVSTRARVELDRAVWAVETSVGGRLSESGLELGKVVKEGDLLARIDASQEQLELKAGRSRVASLTAQLEALEAELLAQEEALDDAESSEILAVREASARQAESELVAGLAKREHEMAAGLLPEGYVSELSVLRVETELRRAEAAVFNLPATLAREGSERQALRSERRALLARLRREQQGLLGDRDLALARVAELERSLQLHELRSPAAGTIAEVTPLARGSHVVAGKRLGVVVSPASLYVVGEFSPAEALGRVVVGQTARLRLDGFPWSQFGEVELEVSRVAGEVQLGHLRVEFRLRGEPPAGIDLQHGLAGLCYVDVEEASPAELLLRAAGGGTRGEVSQGAQE